MSCFATILTQMITGLVHTWTSSELIDGLQCMTNEDLKMTVVALTGAESCDVVTCSAEVDIGTAFFFGATV
jgi:hypothetical protein